MEQINKTLLLRITISTEIDEVMAFGEIEGEEARGDKINGGHVVNLRSILKRFPTLKYPRNGPVINFLVFYPNTHLIFSGILKKQKQKEI